MTSRTLYAGVIAVLLSVLAACAPNPKPEFEAWSADKRAEAQINLGLNYLQRNKLDIARESFENALSADPKSSKAYHGLGLVEAKSLNLKKAREYLRRSVELDSSNIPAVSDYAVMLCQAGSAQRGTKLLQDSIKDPARAGLAEKLAFGRCYEAIGEVEKAGVAYEEVLKINPKTPQALLSMAYIRFNAKNYLSASAYMQRYFYTNTISSDALLLAAKVENNLNNPEERDYYTQQLWSRYPRSEQAKIARELYSQ